MFKIIFGLFLATDPPSLKLRRGKGAEASEDEDDSNKEIDI